MTRPSCWRVWFLLHHLIFQLHLFHYLHHHVHLFDRRFRHLWMVGATSNILGWINRKYVCLTFWKFVLSQLKFPSLSKISLSRLVGGISEQITVVSSGFPSRTLSKSVRIVEGLPGTVLWPPKCDLERSGLVFFTWNEYLLTGMLVKSLAASANTADLVHDSCFLQVCTLISQGNFCLRNWKAPGFFLLIWHTFQKEGALLCYLHVKKNDLFGSSSSWLLSL